MYIFLINNKQKDRNKPSILSFLNKYMVYIQQSELFKRLSAYPKPPTRAVMSVPNIL